MTSKFDPYKILDLSKNATEEEIKKAFRKASLKWHPDRNPTCVEKSTEKFKEITEANEILSNPQKRKIYDTEGMEGLKKMGNGPTHIARSNDVHYKLELTLKKLITGGYATISFPRKGVCEGCEGKGTDPKKRQAGQEHISCSKCNGKGIVIGNIQIPGFPVAIQSAIPCDLCGGKKEEIPNHLKCTTCNGNKVTMQIFTTEVYVPASTPVGHKINLQDKGEHEPGMEPGDLIIHLFQLADPYFTRQDNDLICKRQITLQEALCGYISTILHPNGEIIDIKIEGSDLPISFQNPCHKIKGKGYSSEGDLSINFEIIFPKKGSYDIQKILGLEWKF